MAILTILSPVRLPFRHTGNVVALISYQFISQQLEISGKETSTVEKETAYLKEAFEHSHRSQPRQAHETFPQTFPGCGNNIV